MPRLAISLFGSFHVMLDGTPVTEFKTNKVQALLKVCAGDHWNDRSLQAEKRGLGTLRATMRDRAMQALVKLAFEPEW